MSTKATAATTTTLHCTTVRYLHYTTRHYTTPTTATTTTTITTTTTLHYTILHYSTRHCSTLHYITVHYTTSGAVITQHHNYNCNYTYTTLITLQYNCNSTPLHHTTTTTTTTTALHQTTFSSCGWGDHCNHCSHSKTHNSNHLSAHQCIRSAMHPNNSPLL